MKRSFLSLVAIALVASACSAAATPSPTSVTPTQAPMTQSPTMAPATAAPSAAAAGDIVEVATEAGSFNTLLQAATAAGLVETLQGAGPFTVFAPSDEAFAKLPADTLAGLLADPVALKQVLLYHVVSGEVMASQVVGMTSATTVEGDPIAISVKDGSVYLNDTTKVVTTDIAASNGVIHVIDTVLLPPGM
jgi:uncharacterized surface protein with fasciclin (FAS1) repeats